MIPFAVALFFGVWVCLTGPAFDEYREKKRRRLDFARAKLLVAGPCSTCGRPRCPYR